MVLIKVHRFARNVVRYTPPPAIAEASNRFWARTERFEGHRLWAGPVRTKGRRSVVCVRGEEIYIHDFAYRAHWGEIWPHLRAAPSCSYELCVEPGHLHLTRSGRAPFPDLTEADWDGLARRLYDRGDRAYHPHLNYPDRIGEIYQLDDEDLAYRELTARVRYLWSDSITVDAPRHVEP